MRWLRASLGRWPIAFLTLAILVPTVALVSCLLGVERLQEIARQDELLLGEDELCERLEPLAMIARGEATHNGQLLTSVSAAFDQGIVALRGPNDRFTPENLKRIDRRWSLIKPRLAVVARGAPRAEENAQRSTLRIALPLLARDIQATQAALNSEAGNLRLHLKLLTLLAVAISVALIFIGVALMRGWVLAPLQDLTAATLRFQKGDTSAKAAVLYDDELGLLAASFNAMVEQHNRLDHQMKQVFDQCPMDIFLKDLEGRYTFVNARGSKHFQRPPEQMIGRRVDDLASPEAAAISRASDRRVIDLQRPLVEEHNYPYASGPTRILLAKFPLKRSDGTLYGIGGFAADLSDVREAQEKLIESELRHKALFDANWDALMILEPPSWNFTACNPAAVKMFAAKDETHLLSVGPSDVSPLRQSDGRLSQEKTREMIELTIKKGHHSFEWTHTRLNGEVFPCTILLSSLQINGKGVIQASVRDVTQRVHEEENRQRLSTAIEHAGESIVITDPKGTIVYVNPAFEKATGYSREEAIGQNPRILKSGKQDEAFYREMWATITSGRTWKGRLINKRKDGVLRVKEASISPVLDTHGKIVNYVAVKWDVTDRVQMESELRQAQKMESVGRLAGGVAHDFNNILTAIIGYAQFLETDAAEGKAQVSDVKEILIAANRAASLTRQLLAFSRRQVLEPKKISLNDIVANIHKMLARLIGEDIKITTALARELPAVMADPGQIEQVLMNLTVNARDAMPNGGSITIKTAEILLDAGSAKDFRGAAPGIYAMVTVSDTGVGMDEATKARVFEPFFTTKGPGKGTGLGLSMVYGIVKQSGGFVYFTSEPGKGTTFKIILPITNEPAEGPKKKTDGGLVTGRETILLVEDEVAVRGIALRALKGAGHAVIEASSGVEALRLAAEFKGEIHLMLSDIVMPGMDGWQLSERMAELFPETKVLLMSGYTEKAALHREMQTPGGNFLQKPFTPNGLVRKVRQVLDAPSRQTRPTKL